MQRRGPGRPFRICVVAEGGRRDARVASRHPVAGVARLPLGLSALRGGVSLRRQRGRARRGDRLVLSARLRGTGPPLPGRAAGREAVIDSGLLILSGGCNGDCKAVLVMPLSGGAVAETISV